MFSITKPSDDAVRGFLARQAKSRFSYSEVGASAKSAGASGYATDHNRWRLGHGEVAWNHAVRAVQSWQMFNLSWVKLCWPDTPIAEGAEVAVLIRIFGVWSFNAARIVYVIHEEEGPIRRYGFAYGTLPDHSESGEERFSVEWHCQDNSVWYDLYSFSRPRAFAARLAAPLVRGLQRQFRRDSAAAMAKAVAIEQSSI